MPISTLCHRKHGRRSKEALAQSRQYLTPEEEKALVKFVLLMSSLGHPVRIKFMRSLAFRIALRRSANRPLKPPGPNWPRAFEKRHVELKARRVKAMDWKRHDSHIYDKVIEWFEVIRKVLEDPKVLPENVYNMDETGVMLSMLGSVKVLVGKDDTRDYRGAGVKRQMVSSIECISADGRSLLPLIIWPASTHRSNWTTYPTPGWHYGHSDNGYNDSKISLEWLTRVFDPQTRDIAKGKPRVLIFDGFGTHETPEALGFCLENNIIPCRLPSHTSHKLQPCDVGVFAPLKAAYRDQVEKLNRGGVDHIGKEYFTSLYKPARDKAITRRNILSGWAATGLFPLNPDRVLRGIQKPPPKLTIPDAQPASDLRDEVMQTPLTPVTPKTADALTSLQNLIEKDAHALDETSKQRLQKHIRKITTAAKVSFAECALLQDQNRFLFQVNNVKVRRSTRSLVVGKAKVFSYEDIEERLAKREVEAQAAAMKEKRGRKRKAPATEEGKAEAGPSASKRKAALLSSGTGPANGMEESWKAPIAQMY